MKVAVIGSRNIKIIDLKKYLPIETDKLVSGGARGIDTCAKEYAMLNNIKPTEFLPQYERYGRVAPLKRNLQIIDYADIVIAFWDGKSHGTKHVIDNCRKQNKEIRVYLSDETIHTDKNYK